MTVLTAGDGTVCFCGDAEGPGQGQKGLKLVFSPACVHGRKLCEGKSWCRAGCYLPAGREMGQSFDSRRSFGLVGRHVCFLTSLQPADNSLHNAVAQIGSRGF